METGLNKAVKLGVSRVGELGFSRAIIAHGDLPLAQGFCPLAHRNDEIVIASDRYESDTNVLSLA